MDKAKVAPEESAYVEIVNGSAEKRPSSKDGEGSSGGDEEKKEAENIQMVGMVEVVRCFQFLFYWPVGLAHSIFFFSHSS